MQFYIQFLLDLCIRKFLFVREKLRRLMQGYSKVFVMIKKYQNTWLQFFISILILNYDEIYQNSELFCVVKISNVNNYYIYVICF